MSKISKISLILIFLIIFVLLSGFFAIKQAQKISEIESDEGKTKLTIRTNKNEYKQGEIVEIFIKNNGLKPIWYNKETCPPFCCWLQKLENGKWKDFKAIGTVVVDLRVRPSKLNPGEEISRKWSTTKKENGREISMIEPGIYRIAFNYGLTKDSFNEKTIYSNEFIIK